MTEIIGSASDWRQWNNFVPYENLLEAKNAQQALARFVGKVFKSEQKYLVC